MTDLKLDPRNAKRHSDKNKKQIKQSLDAVGAGRSILADADGIVRAGNGVLEQWGDRPVKIIESDGKELVVVQRTDLRGKDAIRAAALDNLAADSSAYDYDAQILAEIARDDELVRQLAQEDAKLRELLKGANGHEKQDPGELIDKAAQLQEKWQVVRGDVCQIGKHRLMCGDSTSKEDVDRLMDGKRAQAVVTDPPYLVNYDGGRHPQSWSNRGAANRDKHWDEYHEQAEASGFYEAFVRVALEQAVMEDAAWYQFYASLRAAEVFEGWHKNNLITHAVIVWVKARPVLTHTWYMWQHELCVYGWIKGHQPKVKPPSNATTVWMIDQQGDDDAPHPTQKPTKLIATAIEHSTLLGQLIYEPFAGSGTTLVACEQTGRIGYGMEIEPKYCAVSLERLSNLGLSCERLSN